MRLERDGRVFRDHSDEPFIILRYERPFVPMVVLRQHDFQPERMVVTRALCALKEVASRRLGSQYYIDVWSCEEFGHWFALARKLIQRKVGNES